MRAVITGGAGFVGKHVTRKAVQAGWDVVNFDALTDAATLSEVWDLEEAPNYSLVPGNVCDPKAFLQVLQDHQPNCILHLAQDGPTALPQGSGDRYLLTNVHGTGAVIEASARYFANVGKPEGFRIVQADFTPPPQHATIKPFLASKEAARVLVKGWRATGNLPIIQTFAPTVFGPYQSVLELIPSMLSAAVNGREMTLPSGPGSAINLIYVDDYANALLWAAEHGQTDRSYEFNGPRKIRPSGIAKSIVKWALEEGLETAQSFESNANWVPVDQTNKEDPMDWGQDHDWAASMPFEMALKRTVRWYVKNSSGLSNVKDAVSQKPQEDAA